MSGLHVYCIVPPGHAPATGVTGIRDASVALLPVPTLGVWYSRHDLPPAAEPEALRRHNAVVQAACTASVTAVPARFGQWFDSSVAAVEGLTRDVSRWLELLRCFAGRAEYGVRVLPDDAASEPARDVRPQRVVSGTEYMMALRQRHAGAAARREHAREIADMIERSVAGLVAGSRLDVEGATGSVAVSHLVAHCDRDAYHERLKQVHRARPELNLLVTGPWPPYSFTA